ncbi:minor tail protein [Mycobacterium phage Mendokysei]|uniref:Minor tail protein n=1 Tax=Mycobacterium phage Mendokysei TaxID=2099637 RepID=A0A2P1CG99_9CAUD|nr:minor tail protein [Mycobacterium phage Mendokysei]AVJ50237.1 minor tail protein [Mycobacterium phage Mendokysei]
MTLTQRASEVRAIAKQLWFLPPPARNPIADKLHGLGLRHHAELATLELQRSGPAEMGNHAPQQVVSKHIAQEGMDALRAMNPEMAAKIEQARADQETAARIAACQTNAERVSLARELGFDVPDDVVQAACDLHARVDAMDPSQFEPKAAD